MDKLCKKIMDFMQRNGSTTSFSCSISDSWNEYADLPFYKLIEDVKDDPDNVKSAIEELVDDGWLEYRNLHSSSGDIYIAVYMTHKGLHQKELKWQETKDFLIKSLFVPIVVSVITSLIVTWIGYLWTMSGIKTDHASQIPSSEPTIEDTTANITVAEAS